MLTFGIVKMSFESKEIMPYFAKFLQMWTCHVPPILYINSKLNVLSYLFAGAANWFEQQASKSARVPIPCCFSSPCAIVYSANFRKYSFMFSSVNYALYNKVHNWYLESAVQKNIDKTYPFSLFWGKCFKFYVIDNVIL